MSGPRSDPPSLPGFTHQRWLGGGGFADVFLYRQARPARDVAVKVLRPNVLTAEVQASLDAEADLMARVSTHPYIVTIHGTDTAPDGRPYLVMEYYPGASFAEHVRNGGLGVPDVLRLGVRVASAVESAHRAGVLHRDIKPANILTSAYGHPGLTDFGIAGTRRAGVVDELTGVSVPYAPPELLTDASQGDERSDVYSLSATLYALLAGRSPFERPGAGNDVTALMYRAIHEAVPAITRNDVPDMLERALVHGMARQPERRPASMAGFARVLNDVERALQLTPTAFDVLSNAVAPTERSVDDRDGTRLTRVQVVDPHARPAPPASGATTGRRGAGVARAPVPFDAVRPADAAPAASLPPPPSDTVMRAAAAGPSSDVVGADGAAPASRPWPLAAAGAVAALAVVVLVLVAPWRTSGDRAEESPSPTSAPGQDALVVTGTPPVPVDVEVVRSGSGVEVRWSSPGAEPDDEFQVRRVDEGHEERYRTDETTFALPADGAERPCVVVEAIRGPRISDPSERSCAAP